MPYTTSMKNSWNTVKGVKASTTHNVFGIYDLAGGRPEYVSAYYTGGSSTYLSSDTTDKRYAGALYTNRNTKYVETYDTAYSPSKIGDAVYETSIKSSTYANLHDAWDYTCGNTPTSSDPVFLRENLFYFSNATGYICYENTSTMNNYGFRHVLSIK